MQLEFFSEIPRYSKLKFFRFWLPKEPSSAPENSFVMSYRWFDSKKVVVNF